MEPTQQEAQPRNGQKPSLDHALGVLDPTLPETIMGFPVFSNPLGLKPSGAGFSITVNWRQPT